MEGLVEVNNEFTDFNYDMLFGPMKIAMGFISYPPRVMKDQSYAVLSLDVSLLDASDNRRVTEKNKIGWKFHISLNQDIDGNNVIIYDENEENGCSRCCNFF